MDPLERALALFDELCDAPGEVRRARLDDVREADPELVRVVEELLQGDQRADPRLDARAVDQLTGASLGVLRAETADPTREWPEEQRRYEQEGQVGAGGMGVVLRVLDRKLLRLVAMKVIGREENTPWSRSEQSRRFLREALVTAQLEHPGIVPVHDIGVGTDGQLFFTMKLVDGVTLEQLAGDPRRRPSTAELVRIVQRVCEAVGFANHRGFVHRDLKPANVMVGRFGEVQVMDWGLALARDSSTADRSPNRTGAGTAENPPATSPGEVSGTLNYMAPEQARACATQIDERTDVFGLGGLLYYLLAGRPPYEGSSREVLARATEGRLDDPLFGDAQRSVPPELRAVCAKALQRDPERRYAGALELAEDLRAWLEDRQGLAWRDSPPVRAAKVARRYPGRSALAATLAILAPLILFAWSQYDRRRLEADRRAVLQQEFADLETLRRLEEIRDQVSHISPDGSIDLAGVMGGWLALFAERVVPLDDEVEPAEVARELARVGERHPPLSRALADSLYDITLLCSMNLVSQAAWMAEGYEVGSLLEEGREAARAAETRSRELVAFHPRLEELIEACEQDPWRHGVWQAWRAALIGGADSGAFHAYVEDGAELTRRSARDLLLLANFAHRLFGDEASRGLYERAQATDPSMYWPHVRLAQIALRGKDPERALRELRAAEALNPGSGHVSSNLCVALDMLRLWDQAERHGRRAVERMPENPRAWNNLGLCLMHSGSLEEAVAHLGRATELDPKYANAWRNLGEAFVALGKSEEALEAVDRALELGLRSVDVLVLASLAHCQLGQYDRAIARCELAIALDPGDWHGWFNQILAMRDAGLHERAMATLARAMDADAAFTRRLPPQCEPHLSNLRQEYELLLEDPARLAPPQRARRAELALHRNEPLHALELLEPIVQELASAADPWRAAQAYGGAPHTHPVRLAVHAAARAASGLGFQHVPGAALLEPGDPDLPGAGRELLPRIAPADRPPLPSDDAATEALTYRAADLLELWITWQREDAGAAEPRIAPESRLAVLDEVASSEVLRALARTPSLGALLEEVDGWIRELKDEP